MTGSVPTKPSPGLPGARTVDHYAFTVPDLDQAVRFSTQAMGGSLCYREGPIQHPDTDWMQRKLGVHPRATARIALVRLGSNCNLELFEYAAPEQVRTMPAPGQPGACHLTWWVNDTTAARAWLTRLGLRSRDGDQHDEIHFSTPWGMPCTLRAHPSAAPQAGGGTPTSSNGLGLLALAQATYTVADLARSTAFFRDILGCEPIGAPARSHTLLRCGPTAIVELRQADQPLTPPPSNSDIGGHHLAFYVDDVDKAAHHLGSVEGVHLMGTPETVADGPITGDRWLYFQTPTGLQMEIINLPDGLLPYEQLTTARRVTPGDRRWHDQP
ncbi:VOC family protein [Streptomyces sp. NPDC047046]|uniref:VOC family protein n=1 Tax=Streptomyces sp. NPDC047046 TaxID=3155378 RepID=UPI0033D9D28C